MKLIPDLFVTSKMIKNLFAVSYGDENILYCIDDYGDSVFNYNEMSIVNIDLNNISLDDNFDEYDPDSIILVRLLA